MCKVSDLPEPDLRTRKFFEDTIVRAQIRSRFVHENLGELEREHVHTKIDFHTQKHRNIIDAINTFKSLLIYV